ncbi:MAG: hypothetical protein M3463_05535 [Verrucomicrobiota bacterium]|nr:hypothetical protein [Verrucomicrobiota bacterium]
MKTLFNTLAVAILSLSFASTGFTADDAQEDSHESRRLNLEGSWLVSVERPGLPPLLALETFTFRGEYIGTRNTTQSSASPAHGSWVRTGNRRFTKTHYAFLFDAAGNHNGMVRNSMNIRLDGRDEFHAVHLVERFDLDGNLISSNLAASTGTRLPVVHFPEHP